MTKHNKFFINIAVYIIVMSGIAIANTFLTSYIQSTGFFGDSLNTQDKASLQDVHYNWGNRHYFYYWMCVCLFILSIIRKIIWSVNYWETK